MQRSIKAAPTLIYPETDGKPMAETDTHRKFMMAFIQMLEDHFQNDKDVYISGNLMMYYVQGDPKQCVSPDVFVVFGVGKKARNTYKTWEEGQTPDFVLEVSSRSTYRHDLSDKKRLYAETLAVQEYFIYDPSGQIPVAFTGFRLVDGTYREIESVNDRLPSAVLGLELGEREESLGLYNPDTKQWLLTPDERVKQANAYIQQEAQARQNAEVQAQQEAQARRNAEAELARALAEIERLRSSSNG